MRTFARYLIAMIVICGSLCASAEEGYDASIKAILHDNFDQKDYGMVVGVVDGDGTRVFSAGTLGNGTDQEVDGDTVFDICSITKTFTALLLQDMVARGQMKLDDPVAKYLPESVKVPTYGGKEITLANLAAQDSGLPRDPNNLPKWQLPKNPFADYSADKLYAFLSACELKRDPGLEFEYSNAGMALLGSAITRTADADFESLLVERICRPLGMNSTRIVPTGELKSRLAIGHDKFGKPTPNWDFQVYQGAGGIRSTVNDMLKYVSAHLGKEPKTLWPLIERNIQVRHHGGAPYGSTAMPWYDRGQSEQTGQLLWGHGGGNPGYHAFIGFDKEQGRGVVVLSNQLDIVGSESLGWLILQRIALSPGVVSVLVSGKEKSLVGIGVALDFDRVTHSIRIGKVLPNSPASDAGLTDGMVIKKVGDISVANKSLLECQGLILGADGTKVRLELSPAESNENKTIELVRRKFQI